MSDRFDEMAGRVQLDMESYALRQSIDGRKRVIAEALRSAYERGREEGAALPAARQQPAADMHALCKSQNLPCRVCNPMEPATPPPAVSAPECRTCHIPLFAGDQCISCRLAASERTALPVASAASGMKARTLASTRILAQLYPQAEPEGEGLPAGWARDGVGAIDEAADVANFAMMLADNLQASINEREELRPRLGQRLDADAAYRVRVAEFACAFDAWSADASDGFEGAARTSRLEAARNALLPDHPERTSAESKSAGDGGGRG